MGRSGVGIEAQCAVQCVLGGFGIARPTARVQRQGEGVLHRGVLGVHGGGAGVGAHLKNEASDDKGEVKKRRGKGSETGEGSRKREKVI